MDPHPVGSGQHQHISPRYERKGALQLFQALSVADGKVYGQARNRKRFVGFQAFLLQGIIAEALQPGVDTIRLILDNSTSHAPKQLEDWLQTQFETWGWSLTIEVLWLPKNASWPEPDRDLVQYLAKKIVAVQSFPKLAPFGSSD